MAVWLAIQDQNETTAVRRGDFPAFWALAVIAAGDEPHRLYDLELQRRIQNRSWPALAGSVLPAAYPPYVAYVLQPLARFDHRTARQIWTTISLFASFISVLLLVRGNRSVLWSAWMVWTLLLLFSPTLRGVVGGQLISIVMLLISLCAIFTRRSSWRADLLLGIALGGLLCKPYYALAALVIPTLQRRWLTIAIFVVIALGWSVCAAKVPGDNWLVEWGTFAASFTQINLDANAQQMPNLLAQLYRLSVGVNNFGPSAWIAAVTSYVILASVAYLLVGAETLRMLLKFPRQNGELLLCLLLSLVVVSMPQVNFYDLGVISCAMIALFDSGHFFDRITVAVCILLSQFGVSPPFGAPVHFALGLIGVGYVCIRVRELALHHDSDDAA